MFWDILQVWCIVANSIDPSQWSLSILPIILGIKLKTRQKSIPTMKRCVMDGIIKSFKVAMLFLKVTVTSIQPSTVWLFPSAVLTFDLHLKKFGRFDKSSKAKSAPMQLMLAPVSKSPYSLPVKKTTYKLFSAKSMQFVEPTQTKCWTFWFL